MTKQIELEILGERRLLVFNNYARVEIAKHIDSPADPVTFLQSIERIHNTNSLLLLKILVYAGHCGDCYRRQSVTDLTMDQVGDWIGEANDDALYQVFNTFLEAEGVKLPPDELKDEDDTKKKKRGGKSSNSRSVKSE